MTLLIILLIIITFVLYVAIFVPLCVSLKLNITPSDANFSVHIFKKQIYLASIVFTESGLFLQSKSGKKKRIRLAEFEVAKISSYTKYLWNKNLEVSFFGGIEGDAFGSAMLCGSFNSLSAIASPYFSLNKIDYRSNVVMAHNNEFKLVANFNAKISVARMCLAIVFGGLM